MRIWLIVFILLIIEIVILLYMLVLPANPFADEELTILIPRSSSTKDIAKELKKLGVINSEWGFRILVKLRKSDTILKAGEYLVRKSQAPLTILKKIESGDFVKRPVTVIPCSTVVDLVNEMVKAGLTSKDEAEEAIYSPEVFKKFGLTYPSLEGYIIAETYIFTRPIRAVEIVETMISKSMELLRAHSIEEKARPLGLNLHEVLTLASIIEAEAQDPFERPLISSVFHNRLKLQMPLQADPTVAYGLKKDGKSLTREDLATPNPFNTYLNKGLPPSPICFPSIDSVISAVEPLQTDYLYFVSDGAGRHKFSVDYQEHLRNVQEYREAMKTKGQ